MSDEKVEIYFFEMLSCAWGREMEHMLESEVYE